MASGFIRPTESQKHRKNSVPQYSRGHLYPIKDRQKEIPDF